METSTLNEIAEAIKENMRVKTELLEMVPQIEKLIGLGRTTLSSGHKIFLFGNGGSAADAQHIAGEFVGKPVIALTTNASILTAIANDYRYEDIFVKQLNGLCRKGDLAIGISTSGHSQNVVEGLNAAKWLGAATVLLTGGNTLTWLDWVRPDLVLDVPSTKTARIQEAHILIGHIFAEALQ